MNHNKKFLSAVGLLLLSTFGMAQDADPIVMHINGSPVPRSEFEYNYNKNNSDGVVDKKSVKEYTELFVNYKLKVLAAMDAKYDTLTSFNEEFRTYRDQQIRPMLVPETQMENECLKYYQKMQESLNGHDLIQPAHIFLRVQQSASVEEQNKAKERIDSAYNALKGGADFAALAKEISQDPQSAVRGGTLPWLGPNQTVKEFEDVAYGLQKGEMSEPFLSPVGYHIVKMLDRKPLESYAELQPNILKFLESQGMKDRLATQLLDSISQKSDPQKSVEEILDEETERLCQQDEELKYLIQEYHDGLLLFEICNREVWEPASKDTLGLKNYFNDHKQQYAWSEPHFNGMIYYCREKADVKAVKKALKKVPEEKWTSTVREQFNKDSVTVRMEKRVFKQGDNVNVDALALKVKEAKTVENKDFPYMGVLGEKLKKGPKKWTDVSSQVVTDYQRKKEDEFVAELRKKYTVDIHQDVLDTVNNH